MKKIIVMATFAFVLSFLLPMPPQQLDALLEPPSDPVGCQKCGRIEIHAPDGNVYVIDPACVEAPFGSGGYLFCEITAFGCDLKSLCQAV